MMHCINKSKLGIYYDNNVWDINTFYTKLTNKSTISLIQLKDIHILKPLGVG